MRTTTLLLAFITLPAHLTVLSAAQQMTGLPMDLTAVHDGTLEFNQSPPALAALGGLDKVVMRGVPLPVGPAVDLELDRLRFDFSSVGVFVDGKRSRFDPGDMTLWSGKVRGVENSDVQLCFSSQGSYGWIFNGIEYTHVSSTPGEDGTWKLARVRMISDQTMMRAGNGLPPSTCMLDQMGPTPGSGGGVQVDDSGPPTFGAATKLELKQAIETDWQLYQLWNDLNAEQTYVMALLAAKSARYDSQVDIVVTYPYVQFYTTANDPWTSQDGGGSSVDLLYEFQAAWKFNIPGGAHLAHFLSGASLGGGVAWVDVLCNPEYGFAVSGNINGGLTFPVTQGSNTWDFMVFAHETGHNVGTWHTHDYCPPLDECAPSGYFGSCQSQQACISNGTIMSYCHLCSGGMSNITTFFHPTVVATMRNEAENSCLPDYGQPQVLFSDDFESGDLVTGGWTKKNKRVKVHTGAANQGTYGVRLRRKFWLEKALDTSAYEDITVNFTRRTKNYDAGESLKVRFHDGTGWTDIEVTTDTAWNTMSFMLPATANDNANFRLRFKSSGDEAKERGDIDDVQIIGTPQ
jgi:hypothetical protein